MLPALVLLLLAPPPVPEYQLLHRIPVGGEGGWDYLTANSDSHRLFVSHGSHVVVIDTAQDKVIGDIPNTPGVHGIALAPSLGRGFISSGGEDSVVVFDLGALKGNIGDQNYEVPDGVDPTSYTSVVVWCDRFNVSFGAADLQPVA